MSFETDVLKLQKMWEETQANNQGLTDAHMIQKMQETMAKQNIVPRDFIVNYLNNIGGDYQGSTILMTAPYQVTAFTWQVIKTLPEAWIPLIRIDIAYNFVGSATAFNNVSSYLNKVLNVQKTATDGIVEATWNIGWYFVQYNSSDVLPSFEAKLLFSLIPPSQAR